MGLAFGVGGVNEAVNIQRANDGGSDLSRHLWESRFLTRHMNVGMGA